jgi:hypothetical protein
LISLTFTARLFTVAFTAGAVAFTVPRAVRFPLSRLIPVPFAARPVPFTRLIPLAFAGSPFTLIAAAALGGDGKFILGERVVFVAVEFLEHPFGAIGDFRAIGAFPHGQKFLENDFLIAVLVVGAEHFRDPAALLL